MKCLTFVILVSVPAVSAASSRGGAAPTPDYRAHAPAISSRCGQGQLLVAENRERFPIYYTIVTEPARPVDSPVSQTPLGNTGPLQTDTLVEINASVQRVIAWPDKAHEMPGPWGPTNRANVRFTCVST